MLKKVDLHIHSYASDGQWSAEDLVANVDDNDIKLFAVCDHDEIGCVPEVAALVADREDLTYIKGVEISVTYKGRECHILTYGIDENDAGLLEILEMNRTIRDDYNDRLIEFLESDYPQVNLDDYRAYDYYPYQGGWRTYCYLIDRKVIDGLGDYFAKIAGFDYDKNFIGPQEMLEKLNGLGYTTILAHPPAYAEGDLYDSEELDNWREWGIQGLECYTQYMKDQRNSAYYVDYCREYDLMITGGSDCHGGFAGRRLGHPDVDTSVIRFMLR